MSPMIEAAIETQTDESTGDREFQRRRDSVGTKLREHAQDALLFTREGNVAYLCGYTTATWSNFSRPVVGLLSADGELAMIVAETEADAVGERIADVAVHTYVELRSVEASGRLPDGRVQFIPQAVEVLSGLLVTWGVKSLAVDGLGTAFPPVAQLAPLLPDGPWRISDASDLLWRERMVKSDWEVQRLRQSCSVLENAFEALEAELAPELTEREIHAALAANVYRAGADSLGYTNVVAGVHRGLFGSPSDRRWSREDVLYVDGGAVVDGYWADFCRMYVTSDADEAASRGYARALRGLDAATETFETGMTAADLAARIAAACQIRPGDVGFGRFGHGIGLYMPEPPSIHPLDDTELAEGFVLCVEPAVTHNGANYVVEEQHLVCDGRLHRLSPAAPKSLIEVA